MSKQTKKLLDEALGLPESDRAYIVASLIDSLDTGTDADVDKAWKREFDRRLQQLNSGTATIPWTEARKKILEIIS